MIFDVHKKLFGQTKKGEPVYLFTLSTENIKISVSEYGAAIVSMLVRDREGCFRDVVLGFDSVSQYEEDPLFLGATIGRTSGILSDAGFYLGGVRCHLEKQDGQHFHGGPHGFAKRLWQGKTDDTGLRMTLSSADGEGGYPGNLEVSVTFLLDMNDSLIIRYAAVSDSDTCLNMTNHTYFNLNGHDSGPCTEHQLTVAADRFIPVDKDQIPFGTQNSVVNTPFDFRQQHAIGERIQSPSEQIKWMKGYDHYLVFQEACLSDAPVIRLSSFTSGISMTVSTSMPGVYLYTGNGFKKPGISGKKNCLYGPHAGVAIETQFYPDGPNHAGFICPILRAYEKYRHETRYRFEAVKNTTF